MNNVYFIHGNRIAVQKGYYRPSGIFIDYPDAAFVTPNGVILPCSSNWGLTDLQLRGLAVPMNAGQEQWTAGVVRPDGVLVEYYYMGVSGELFNQSSFPTYPGVKFARSNRLPGEEAGDAALKLTKTLEEAVELYCRVEGAKYDKFRFTTIEELAAQARNCR